MTIVKSYYYNRVVQHNAKWDHYSIGLLKFIQLYFALKYNGEIITVNGTCVFYLDERIQSTTFVLGDWPLSRVLLKNEDHYPWFILVPRQENIQEIYQLTKEDRQILMEEVSYLSLLVREYYKSDKINIGALGNVVPQLHIHVVARNQDDPLWPQGIWQASLQNTPCADQKLKKLLPVLKDLIRAKGLEMVP